MNAIHVVLRCLIDDDGSVSLYIAISS